MKKLTSNLFFLLLLLLTTSISWANPQLDSLSRILESTDSDTTRVRLLSNMSELAQDDSIELATDYADQALALAEKVNEPISLIQALLAKAGTYDFLDNYSQLYATAERALAIAQEHEFLTEAAKAYHSMGRSRLWMGSMSDALDYFHESLQLFEDAGDTSNILNAYKHIGWVYHQSLVFDKTLEYYDLGIKLAIITKNESSLFRFLYDQAWVYYQQENYEKALQAFSTLKYKAEQTHSLYDVAEASSMIGTIYIETEKIDSAMFYYRLTEKIALQEDLHRDIIDAYEGIATVYAARDQKDSAYYYYDQAIALGRQSDRPASVAYIQLSAGDFYIEQQNYSRAIRELTEAKVFFSSVDDKNSTAEILASLSIAYAGQKNYERAYNFLSEQKLLSDSLQSEKTQRLREETEVRYQLRKRDEKINVLNANNALKQAKVDKQQLLLISSTTILILMIGLALASYLAFRQKQRANSLLEDQNEEIRQQHAATEQAKKYVEQHAKRLKELDQFKTKFFANVSHELRTPLTLILGPLQQLIQTEQFEAKTNKRLRLMQRNAKTLLNLVEEILDISKLDADKLQLYETATNVSSFVRRIYANFESQAQYLGIQYSIIEQVPEDYHALIDQKRVEKILNNLLSNALKFTPKEGMVLMTSQLENNQLQIVVKDNGEGINQEDLPHVFERFFQTKQAHSKAVGGTGIGLALSKELTDLMGGQLQVSSTAGKGTTFTLSVPLKQVVKPIETDELVNVDEVFVVEDFTTTTPTIVANKVKVLIVEDNADMQRYIISVIEQHYHYTVANDGQEAWEILVSEEERFDLILSDVMMPRMDGFELLKYVKNSSMHDIPFILLTARAAQEDKLNALTIGVDDYLIKPFFQEELLVRIQNLIANYESRKNWQEEEEKDEKTHAPAVRELAADSSRPDPDQIWIAKVEEEIRQSVHKVDYSINSLAEHMNISTRQFQRKLKKVTGLTPVKYQQEIRLQIARERLETGESHSVKEVAYSVGFQKVSYFSKLYAERFGRRPSDYLR